MNAIQFALDSVDSYGEYTAFQFGEREWTNVEHIDYAARVARVLQDFGVRAGDRVVVVMPNCPEVLACFQAIWRLGAVITPATPQLGERELAYVLEHSDAKLVVTAPGIEDKMIAAAQHAPLCKTILVIGETDAPGVDSIDEAIASAAPIETVYDTADDDLAFLLYTSGTTGHPKGVMLSHRNIMTNHRTIAETGRLKIRSQTILALPLSHSFGVLVMDLCYISGCGAAVIAKFDPEAVVRAIDRYQVTRFSMVPTMLVHLINLPDLERYDLSSLEMVQSGAAILPNEVRLEFERRFDCKVIDGYGMSEAAPALCTYDWGEAFRPGAAGRPIDQVTISIQDEAGTILPPGERGEICAQGPNVMLGYWKNDEATREAMRGGWLHSGDIGYMDEDGYVYLTDRMKDLIIKGGENISPREIEDALYEHPAVSEIVVVGVPDPTYGENIVAVVALKPGEDASKDALIAHAAGYVTKFKLPAEVVFRDTLPRNPNGKIDRKRLRAELADTFSTPTS